MRKIIYLLFVFFPLISMAQLVTSTSQSPTQLVQDVLLGQGVDVSNITFQGASQAIGYFNGANTTLGFNEGILITTGTVMNVPNGPQGPNDRGNATVNNGAGGFNMLTQLVGGTPTYNASVLEFDFIPYSDTVQFRYIFGSEEYREYVNTGFNDVFAFYISGSGYTGYQNLAVLPNATPVTIDNINDGEIINGMYYPTCNNCQYFVYNGDGNEYPYNSQQKYIQYDGYTKPLEVIAPVQCGKKYHLIIAIADVKDDKYDSGIFLEANSLNSNIEAKVDYSLSFDAYGDGVTMSEGCAFATFEVSRPENKADHVMTIPITVSGTATMGVDYNAIPTSVTLNPGETSKTFTITPTQDFITEGTETIQLTFGIPDACGNVIEKEIELKIVDVDELKLTINGGDKLCPNQEVTLTANPIGGSGPYTYLWSTGETSNSITVSPSTDQTYTVQVTESCANQVAKDSIMVQVVPYEPMTIFTSGDVSIPCRNTSTEMEVSFTGGAPNYTIEWTDKNGNKLGYEETLTVSPSDPDVYTVNVTDACGFTVDTTITFSFTTTPLVVDSISGVITCPGMPAQLTANASGGYGVIQYKWSNGATGSSILVAPTSSTTYTVTVTDECQSYSVSTPAKVTVVPPHADFMVSTYPITQGMEVGFENTSTGASFYDWDFGDTISDFGTSTLKNPTHIYDQPGGYIIRLIAISEMGCVDTTYKAIEVMPEYYIYVPNAFTPNGDSHNQYFEVSTVNVIDFYIQIYNRWGERIYDSHDKHFQWDGTYKGLMVTNDVYAWVIDYVPIIGEGKRITGHVTVIR